MIMSIRRRIGVTTALTATAVACAATALTGAAQASAPRATTTTATASAASVPWSRVGSGWTMALWSKSTKSDQTLYLIAPSGTRYALTDVSPDAYLLDWAAGGGPRALISNSLGVRELDLRTGARHTLRGLHNMEVFGYSRPGAKAVFASSDGPKGTIVKVGLDGKRIATYPNTLPVSGRLDVYTGPLSVRSADEIVVGAEHGMAVFGPHGGLVRRLLPTAASCQPQSMLRPGVVVARCGSGALYSVAVTGGKATRLTQGPDRQNPFGYEDVWTYSKGRLGLSPNGCGPSTLVRFTSAGVGNRFTPPAPVSGTGAISYLGHHGNVVEATFHHGQCEAQSTTLFAWNAVTKRSTALLGPGVNGGSVSSVEPYAYDRVG